MEQDNKAKLDGFADLTRALFDPDSVKKTAAFYFEAGEKIAERVLEFQTRSTEWAKDTPLAPVFEVQISMTRKLTELSAETARRLWRIEEKPAA